MRYPRTRHTLSPSTRPVHHGRRTIVGRLVVLSVCMLVCGVTSTPAQTGQDPRCANFSGQAKGLCTAAVAAGCFEGVQSPDCDALTTNWNENCSVCDGAPPWVCPCADRAGSAMELNSLFVAQVFDVGPATTQCIRNEGVYVVSRADGDRNNDPFMSVSQGMGTSGSHLCSYVLIDADGSTIRTSGRILLTPAQTQACRDDIRALQDFLGCP